MFNDKILKSVAEAVKQVLATEKLHPNQQKLDVHEPEKNKLTTKDFEMLRKGKKADVKESNNPFDVKNYKSQLPTKPGEKAGFDSKKISTGTVYTRKPVKDTPMKKEEFEQVDEAKFDPLKHIKNPNPAVKAAAKDVKRSSYAQRAALMKAGGVKDDRGPRGVTQEEASQEEFNKEIKIAQDKSIGKSKAEVAKPAVQSVKQESVEQIDELKKSTLASYVKKASHDVAAKGAMTRQFANDSAAAKKDSNYWDAKKADDKSNKMFAKSWKRRENMGKAVDRLAKEEVMVEGSGSKEKQKTPYRDINSPEYRAAVEKQKQRMAKDKAAEPGKKMLKKEEVEHIEERSLSTGEKAAMEKNVKGMKKNLAGFKERYGKDAKSVMYATATKQAKGE
jgi:hypothetical protein